jgi:cell division protein FtsL
METRGIVSRMMQSKIVLLFLLIATVFSCVRLISEVYRRQNISSEINKLRTQVEALQKDKTDLSALIAYLNTDTYLEDQARTKLGLLKEGESEVIIPDTAKSTLSTNDRSDRTALVSWWDYFFSNK